MTFQTGTSTVTTLDGYAITNALVTAPGKVQFGPVLTDPFLASSVVTTTGSDGQMMEMRIQDVPRYQPIAQAAYAPLAVDRTGALILTPGPITRLPKESLHARSTSREAPAPAEHASPTARSATSGQIRTQGSARSQSPGQAQDPGIGQGPRAATTSPRGLQPLRQKPLPEAITTCSPATFTAAGVSATVNAPFTVTLRDLTPGSGQSSPDVPLSTSAGITGHRVTKEIRLKLTVLDASQQEPAYPVLMTIALAGSAPGSLIVDPDGLRVPCKQARFVWHERDAQGSLVALNEEFEYQLGTRAAYVGAVPDCASPISHR